MKKSLSERVGFAALSLIVAVFMGLTSCGDSKKASLKEAIEEGKRMCPFPIGEIGKITDMDYNMGKNEVTMYYTITDAYTFANLSNNPQLIKENMKMILAGEKFKEMIELMIEANASFICDFKEQGTGKSVKIELNHQDLNEMLNGEKYKSMSNEDLVKNQVTMENNNCPYEIAPGLTIIKVFEEGNNVIYECSVDEEMYSVSLIQENLDEIKESIKEYFKGPAVATLSEIYSELNKSIIYRYKGSESGKSVDVEITGEDLGNL